MLPGTVHSVHSAVAAAVLVSLTNHIRSRGDSVVCVLQTLRLTALIRRNSQSHSCLKYRHTQAAGRQGSGTTRPPHRSVTLHHDWNGCRGWQTAHSPAPPPAAVLLPTDVGLTSVLDLRQFVFVVFVIRIN